MEMSAITDRFLIYQGGKETPKILLDVQQAYQIVNENNARPQSKRFDFIAVHMEDITPEARDILNKSGIPVKFY